MKLRDGVPVALALAALVAFAVFLYSAHQAQSMRAGIAIGSAVSLWLGCITSGFTASAGVRKKLLISAGLVAPIVCAAAYVALLLL